MEKMGCAQILVCRQQEIHEQLILHRDVAWWKGLERTVSASMHRMKSGFQTIAFTFKLSYMYLNATTYAGNWQFNVRVKNYYISEKMLHLTNFDILLQGLG